MVFSNRDIEESPYRMLLLIVVPVLTALFVFIFMRGAFIRPADPEKSEKVGFEIAPGESFRQIAKNLQSRGFIRYAWSIGAIGRLKRIDTKINAGEYIISPSMTPSQILTVLVSGDVVKRAVLVKEGMNIWEVAQVVQDSGLLSKEELEAAMVDRALLDRAGIRGPSFEGFLFPDTYHFSRPVTAEKIIWAMLERGERLWPEEFSVQADKLLMSRAEVLTLASIIEKESGHADEQPIVSSVFHNRLRQGMRLQADPTVVYGLATFGGRLTKEDLQTPTPYNTYVNFGLPPGPIANPGLSAIKAALYPAETDYLYFVADKNGRHVFSTTLSEHNAAVDKYQRNRSDSGN